MKQLKFTPYSLIGFVALLLGLGVVGLGLFQFRISIESSSLGNSEPTEIDSAATVDLKELEKQVPELPKASPALPTPTISSTESQKPATNVALKGALRVSNPTTHPVRLALLAQNLPDNNFGKPAHWDFSPREGSGQGLILSLPEANLKLVKGDILVAFAQDGSREYWGPYVVGETSLPVWDQEAAEWQLVLPP
ncbi:MAG: hypothetical protein WA919_20880 [Coleofasciculaceae cyanobacterium]